ncbi:MAG: transcriptional regulator [Firmicutes bacterium]|nr:transcriptional regulator [Bacillota bacterium]
MTDHKEYLDQHGIKKTKQRILILNILSQAENIMTVEEIYLELSKQGVVISLSTIYRIMELFLAKGLVVKSIIPGNNKGVFSLKRLEHNHHLICLKCKKTVALKGCPLTEFERNVEQQTEFNIVDHNLELYGYCNKCK